MLIALNCDRRVILVFNIDCHGIHGFKTLYATLLRSLGCCGTVRPLVGLVLAVQLIVRLRLSLLSFLETCGDTFLPPVASGHQSVATSAVAFISPGAIEAQPLIPPRFLFLLFLGSCWTWKLALPRGILCLLTPLHETP